MAIDFFVCQFDPRSHEVWVNEEEVGSSWHEVEEVCCRFRNENDGMEYFVGDRGGTPLGPDYQETVEALSWYNENPDLHPAHYELRAKRIHELLRGKNKGIDDLLDEEGGYVIVCNGVVWPILHPTRQAAKKYLDSQIIDSGLRCSITEVRKVVR